MKGEILNKKLLNQLDYGRTCEGRIGCELITNNENSAWISIVKDRLSQKYVLEYLELNSEYDINGCGYDYDKYLLKREFSTFQSIEELEMELSKLNFDTKSMKPIANVEHPVW